MRKVTLPTRSGDHTLNATGHTHTIKNGEFECDECADAIDQLNGNSDFASLGVRTAEVVEDEDEDEAEGDGDDESDPEGDDTDNLPPINVGKAKRKK